MEGIFGALISAFILVPIIHVLISTRSHGGAKVGWLLAVIFFSWVGWIAFLIVTQHEADRQRK